MEVIQSLNHIKKIKRPIATLGMFDGVHIGHQSILNQLNKIANEIDGESVLITFNPHPRMVLQPNCDLKFLTTLEEKEAVLRQFGLKNLVIQEFTRDFSQVTSVEFVKNFLVDQLNIDTLVIGYDHHFGKNREGNFEQLQVLSKEYGFNLIQLQAIEENDVAVSSTKIRNALIEGNIAYANKALNYNYPLSGEVVHGDKIGRTLGFPTANLQVDPNKLIPKDGVYAVDVFVDEKKYLGLLSIGFRETVTNSREHRVEVNILDFDQNIYGETIRLEFLDRLRDEKKFNSLDELILAMNHDKETAILRFGNK